MFLLTEENHGFKDIIGNPAAPTINKLARAYGLAMQYYGVTHPSGPNYVSMLGGGTFGVNSDDPYWLFGVRQPSLTTELDRARAAGAATTRGCRMRATGATAIRSVVWGCPTATRCTSPSTTGSSTSAASTAAPPSCIAQAVYRISHAPVWRHGNDAIVINFDEGTNNAGCCGIRSGGGRALAVVITNRARGRVIDRTAYDHYSLLKTLEGVFGLHCLAMACDAAGGVQVMAPLFAVKPGSRARPVPARLLGARRRLDRNPPVGRQPAPRPGASSPTPGTTAPAATPGAWQDVASPSLSANANNLASVSANSAGDAWAVGDYYTNSNPNVFRNLAEHWDGFRWNVVTTPNPGRARDVLFSVKANNDRECGRWADIRPHRAACSGR